MVFIPPFIVRPYGGFRRAPGGRAAAVHPLMIMGAETKNCHQMMETRMDMTGALLEQMLEHEEAER